MRIFQHDLVGYAFTIDLARELAARGHDVDYVYCASVTTNPRGAVELRPDDPDTLHVHPVVLDQPLDKQSLTRRYRQERAYGHILAGLVPNLCPDIVVSSNAPLDAQASLLAATERAGVPFIFWLQDLIGEATDRLLRGTLPIVGGMVGRHYRRMEAALLRRSSAVIAITDDFVPYVRSAGVRERVEVIPNWAPIAEIPVLPKSNPWSIAHGLDRRFVFMYSGTLGRKHDPMLLQLLAEHIRGVPDVRVVVASEGSGIEILRSAIDADPSLAENLILLPFCAAQDLPEMLATSDVLVALLEPTADRFSVPSKILAYMAAGRPVLALVPPSNHSGQLVVRNHAGVAVNPLDHVALTDACDSMLDDAAIRKEYGANARRYAERAFDRAAIGDRISELLHSVCGTTAAAVRQPHT